MGLIFINALGEMELLLKLLFYKIKVIILKILILILNLKKKILILVN
jgi:hypothetical protein